MPLDPSFVGRSYSPAAAFEVTRGKISEFCDAIGDTSPLSRDPEAARAAGYRDVIAPPTFLTIVNLGAIEAIISDPELGLDYSRMVHGLQSFTHHRPVVAGDELALTPHVDDIFARAGNDFLTVRAEIADAAGEPVCTAKAQLVVRGAEA
ncbi:MAG: MaoC family dehydratase [Actinophytocola sp.]|nr:MaoC family dehydratase [Actinophytocola sp.]